MMKYYLLFSPFHLSKLAHIKMIATPALRLSEILICLFYIPQLHSFASRSASLFSMRRVSRMLIS